MIAGKLFGFPVEEGLFDVVIDILKTEFGLVDGHADANNSGDFRVLVWEDETASADIGFTVMEIRSGRYQEMTKSEMFSTSTIG